MPTLQVCEGRLEGRRDESVQGRRHEGRQGYRTHIDLGGRNHQMPFEYPNICFLN